MLSRSSRFWAFHIQQAVNRDAGFQPVEVRARPGSGAISPRSNCHYARIDITALIAYRLDVASSRKSSFLQIRVSPRQKATLRRLAKAAGTDVSGFVLKRALPDRALEMQRLVDRLSESKDASFILASIADALTKTPAGELQLDVTNIDVRGLGPFLRAYIAAMVEDACYRKGVPVPGWTGGVGALDAPYFASELPSVRLHLLTKSPPPYRRRNIFIDTSVADRV